MCSSNSTFCYIVRSRNSTFCYIVCSSNSTFCYIVCSRNSTFSSHFQVKDDDGVYEVVLISPSVTTFVDVNPSFRLLELDPDTYELVDYHQFNLNITHANGTSNRMRISFNCIRQTSWLSDISTPRVSH